MKNEAVAHAGREMASLVRAFQSGQNIEISEFWDAFSRMLGREASTPADALALIATARTLLFGCPPVDVPAPEENYEAFAMHHVLGLLNRAIAALEASTGEKEYSFTGFGPSLN